MQIDDVKDKSDAVKWINTPGNAELLSLRERAEVVIAIEEFNDTMYEIFLKAKKRIKSEMEECGESVFYAGSNN